MIKKILTIGLVLLGSVSVFAVVIYQSRQIDVPLEDLLVDDLLPSEWFTGLEDVSVNWQINRYLYSRESDNSFYAVSNLGRVWANNRESLPDQKLIQHVFYYDNPIRAAIQYWLSRPERAYYAEWPNFEPWGKSQNRYPSDWRFQVHANQQHLVCALGAPDSCQVWIYWARYGQYILELELFSFNQGMDAGTFTTVAKQIDTHMSSVFGK